MQRPLSARRAGAYRAGSSKQQPLANPRSPRLRNPDQLRRGERYHSRASQRGVNFGRRSGVTFRRRLTARSRLSGQARTFGSRWTAFCPAISFRCRERSAAFSCEQEIAYGGDLVLSQQRRRVANACELNKLGLGPPPGHLLGGVAEQDVGDGAAQDERWAAYLVPHRPQVDVLQRALLEGDGDTRIVGEPEASRLLARTVPGQLAPLGVG